MLAAITKSRTSENDEVAFFINENLPLSITFERREVYADGLELVQSSLEESPWIIFVSGGGLLLLMFLISSPRRRGWAMAVAPVAAWLTLGSAWWCCFSPAWFGPLVAGAAALFLIGSFARRSVSALR
jgi:hypothetical protein